MPRQEEVESGPFKDMRGNWHHPDGRLMDRDEVEAAKRDGTIILGAPVRQPPSAPTRGRRGAAARQEEPEPEPVEEGEPLEGSIRQFYALHEQMGECHQQMGEILESIVEELRQTLEPVMELARQFQSPARAAAKVSAEPRRGGQGAVRKPDDKRLRGNRRNEEDEEEQEEEEQEEE